MQTITVNQAIGDLSRRRNNIHREIETHCHPIAEQVKELEGRLAALMALVGVEQINLADPVAVEGRIGELRREASGLRCMIEHFTRPRREYLGKLDKEIRGLMLQDGSQQIAGPLFDAKPTAGVGV